MNDMRFFADFFLLLIQPNDTISEFYSQLD